MNKVYNAIVLKSIGAKETKSWDFDGSLILLEVGGWLFGGGGVG